MVNVTDIINEARLLYRADSNEITDANMLMFLNNSYHDIENDIVNYVDEDYWYQTWYTTTIAFQNRYSIPPQSVG
jgi:hypothetical protein